MDKDVWKNVMEAASGNAAITPADLAEALLDLRTTLDALSRSCARCQDGLHHIDKQLARISSACHVAYSRVTAELLGE